MFAEKPSLAYTPQPYHIPQLRHIPQPPHIPKPTLTIVAVCQTPLYLQGHLQPGLLIPFADALALPPLYLNQPRLVPSFLIFLIPGAGALGSFSKRSLTPPT